MLEGRCTCLIRAADAEALEALRAEEEELVGALAAAGFEAARVRFEPWSGDRLREVGELIRQRTRMDLRA